MKVTLKSIAEKADVSLSLVSKVLNNKEARVSDDKKVKILQAAQELGYKTRVVAPDLRIKPHNRSVIALLQPSLDFDFLIKLTNAVEAHAKGHGYDVIIFNTHESIERERQCLELCDGYNVDGILVNACDNRANYDHFSWIKERGIPLVFVDRYQYELNCSFVANDNFDGAFRLTEKLIEQGHKDILFVFHGESVFTTVQNARFEGYQAAMTKHGLDCVKEVVYSERSLKYQPIFRPVSGSLRFTAFLLSTAWDFTRLLELLEIMITNEGEKVDIAAFDMFSVPYWAVFTESAIRHINKSILIMEQNVEGMAKAAVDILVSQIKNNQKGIETVSKEVFIKSSLIEI